LNGEAGVERNRSPLKRSIRRLQLKFDVTTLRMKLILLLIATIGLSSTGNATELSGVIKSEDGKPLSGVQILTYAPAGPADILDMHVNTSTKRYEVSTKPDGSFSIPSHGQLVYFHRADLGRSRRSLT